MAIAPPAEGTEGQGSSLPAASTRQLSTSSCYRWRSCLAAAHRTRTPPEPYSRRPSWAKQRRRAPPPPQAPSAARCAQAHAAPLADTGHRQGDCELRFHGHQQARGAPRGARVRVGGEVGRARPDR